MRKPLSLFCHLIFAAAAGLLLSQCSLFDTPPVGNPDPARPIRVPQTIVFERDVKPMLEIECLQCHNSVDARKNAGLNLETRMLAMTTGRRPPIIKPGDPENSILIQVLTLGAAHPTSMPPAPDKIWGVRMEILKKWVQQGAKWPDNVRLMRPQDWPN